MQPDEEELLGDVEGMQAPGLRSGGKTSSRTVAVAFAMTLVACAFVGMIAFFPDQHRSNNSFADVAQALQGKAAATCDVEAPCTNCDKEGTCDTCHAEAQLTCCENDGKSRKTCCEEDAIKQVFNGTGDKNDKCKEECVASDGADCSAWQCCSTDGHKCFKKHEYYSACKATCDKTEIDPWDNQTWSCDELSDSPPPVPLTCAMAHENCKDAACCQDASKTCYKKDEWWSGCRDTDTCEAGKPYSEDVAPWNTPWDCAAITK